jgi:hypothetical protein
MLAVCVAVAVAYGVLTRLHIGNLFQCALTRYGGAYHPKCVNVVRTEVPDNTKPISIYK